MKKCSKCNIEKSLTEFPSRRIAKDRLDYWCKSCHNSATRIYCKKCPWKTTFNSIKQRCNNPNIDCYKNYGGRGIKCLITPEELKILWFRDKAYEMKKASIDRKENDGNYEFGNCRYIEKSENTARQDKSKQEKSIDQYDLNGNFIRTWKSAREIQRILVFNQSNISQVCIGKRKTVNGFIWKFEG